MPRRPSVPRPTSAAEARSLFEPPAPVVQDVEHRYLNGRWVDLDYVELETNLRKV